MKEFLGILVLLLLFSIPTSVSKGEFTLITAGLFCLVGLCLVLMTVIAVVERLAKNAAIDKQAIEKDLNEKV